MFVSLKPEVFREDIYSRAFETLVDVMTETRHELVNYRDIIEISERIKRPKPKKDAKDWSADGPISKKQGFTSKTPSGASFAKETKVCYSGKTMDLNDVECFKCHKKGHNANKCPMPMQRARMERVFSKCDSSRSHLRTKRKRNPSGRSESDIRILIIVTKTLFFAIGSSSMIWLGQFAMSYILDTSTRPMCS